MVLQQRKREIWKLRNAKNYQGAHNHISVGEVVEHTPTWVRIKSRTFHFGKVINTLGDIQVGQTMERIVPWNRIEVVNVLPGDFDYMRAELKIDKQGHVFLRDARYAVPITTAYEKAR